MGSVYMQPKTLREALACLKQDESLRVLAGGTDLLVSWRADKTELDKVLDIGHVTELKGVTRKGDRIEIGAGVTFAELAACETLKSGAPVLCKAAGVVGAPQIRNQGTIGGNIANASPAADMIAVLTVLDATVKMAGSGGEREMPLVAFIQGQHRTALKKDELITGFSIRACDGYGYAHNKIGRRNALAIARLNGACILKMENGCAKEVRLSVGAATNRPLELPEVEKFLTGKQINEETGLKAGEMVAEKVVELTGKRASSVYKLPVIQDFVRDLLIAAAREEVSR